MRSRSGRTARSWRWFRLVAVTAALGSILGAAACASPRLAVDPEVLAAAPADLLERVRADPYNYFRLTNREWTARVCELFAPDIPGEPVVQLHGDAHVEQFAYMKDSWGLDDFDDSARGPALVDIARFLGSVNLAARERGWTRDRARLYDRFFDGYRRGLSDPAYAPPEPAIVRRLRAATPERTHEAFLEWAEAQMRPLTETQSNAVVAAMKVFSSIVRAERPELRDGYFRIVRAGLLKMGVGSAVTGKVLMRVAGRSDDPSDDAVLEAKALRTRDPLPCVEEPAAQPTFRIVEGTKQVGRLRHNILIAGPELALLEMTLQGQHLRDWWVRSWDHTYREITSAEWGSVEDLADIVFDSGVQLGAAAAPTARTPNDAALRARLLTTTERDERSLRRAADQLVAELLRGWRELGGR